VTLGSQVVAFTNNGTLSNANAGGFSINAATTWTNNAPVSLTGGTHTFGNLNNTAAIAFTNATVAFNGLVTNSGAGSVAINGTAATFSGAQTLASLAAVSRTGGTVTVEASIDLGGGTLNLNATTGDWILNGGSILNGTVNQNGGVLVFSASCSNRLSNVTLNGNIAPASGFFRTRWNNVTLNGSVILTGSSTLNVAFEGNQTLSGTWDATATNGSLVFEMQAAGTLTIPSGVSVTGGNLSFSSQCFGNAITLINNGTLRSNVAGRSVTLGSQVVAFTNNGTLSNANASGFSINAATTWTNNAPVSLTGGTHTFGNLNNTSTLAYTDANVSANGTVNNTGSGSLAVNNTTITFSGPLTPAVLTSLIRTGGTVNIATTLDLGGSSQTLNAATGDWRLNGGTIRNGTLNLSGGSLLFDGSCSNRLANLTINGQIALSGSTTSRFIWNSVTLNGGVTQTGSAALSVGFEGSQTLTGVWNNSTSNSSLTLEMQTAGTLTIAQNASISGGFVSFGSACFGLPMTLVNNGEISVAGTNRTLSFAANITYANLNTATGTLTAGILTARDGGRISMPGNVQIRNIAAGASLRLGGNNASIVSANTGQSVIGQLENIDGVFELLEARDFTLTPAGGTLTNNGQIAVSAGSTLSITGNYVQTAQGALVSRISGTALANVGTLNISGTATIAGALTAQYVNGYTQVGCTGSYRVLFANGGLTGTFGSTNLPAKTDPYVAGMNYFGQAANFVSAPRSDIVSIGGFPPGDGLLTGDDFVAFVNAFAAGDLLADVCGIGGPPEPRDGLLTGDDFIAFVNSFAAACP
jgi:hypothetical protein